MLNSAPIRAIFRAASGNSTNKAIATNKFGNAPLGSFAVAYSQLHTGTVDVAGLKLCGLRNSQPAAINCHQERPVARLSGRRQDRFDFTARVDFRAPGG